ncbi:MAG: alpha/beta hydrolase [Proteobacteria bacterium]|nr:alpha/beta hydrolase [Pseudomonadota bacterium]
MTPFKRFTTSLFALIVLLCGTSAYGSALVCKMPSCEERSVTTDDGVHIVVQDWGAKTPNKPTIIFLHGTPFDHTLWQDQIDSNLKQSYRLITMDYRGHGHADEVADPNQFLQNNWANDLAAVLNNPYYKIDKAIVVAHSLGGLLLGDYLLKYGPDKVAGIIMVSAGFDMQGLLAGVTHTPNPNIPCDVKQHSSNLCGELDLVIATLPPPAGISATPEEFLTANERLVELKFVDPIPVGEINFMVSRAILLTQVSRLSIFGGLLTEAGINKVPDIAALNIPTRFLFSDANRTQYLQVYLDRFFPGDVPVIPGSSYKVYHHMDHVPMLQRKTEFNNDIREFAENIFGHHKSK